MVPALDALEHAIIERKLVHKSSSVLNWNMANAVATTDLPAIENSIKTRQRVESMAGLRLASTLISRSEWLARAGEVEFADRVDVYLGLDLSSTTDLTALIMASASDPARVRAYFWKPSDTLREHSYRDFGAGDFRYVQWVTERHMFACTGRSIDPAKIEPLRWVIMVFVEGMISIFGPNKLARAFRFLRQPSRPSAPRPVAKNGSTCPSWR